MLLPPSRVVTFPRGIGSASARAKPDGRPLESPGGSLHVSRSTGRNAPRTSATDPGSRRRRSERLRRSDPSVTATTQTRRKEDLGSARRRDMGEVVRAHGQRAEEEDAVPHAGGDVRDVFQGSQERRRANPARGLPLMTPALVGLGKFTHLISVTFMADLMEVFRQLLAGDALTPEQKARCLLTACEVLSGHGEALQVDTGEFHRQLYAMLGQPLSGTTSGRGFAAAAPATPTGILRIRALQRFLGGYSHVDQGRVAAFMPRGSRAPRSAPKPEKPWGARGVAAAPRRVSTHSVSARERARGHRRVQPTRRRSGVRGWARGDAVGPGAARHHYHPAVAAAADEVARMRLKRRCPGAGQSRPRGACRGSTPRRAGTLGPPSRPRRWVEGEDVGAGPSDKSGGGGGRADAGGGNSRE